MGDQLLSKDSSSWSHPPIGFEQKNVILRHSTLPIKVYYQNHFFISCLFAVAKRSSADSGPEFQGE